MKILALMFGLAIFAHSQTNNKSILSGTVYDANGSVVVKAKAAAINQKGEKFEASTNDEGIYSLNLPFNKYDASYNFKEAKYNIIVEMNGFKKSIIKDFVFVPSQFGKMQLDIGLEIETIIDVITVPSKKINKKSKN